MKFSRSAQTCALGAAIFGAVAGGAYRSTEAAQKAMTSLRERVVEPRNAAVRVYRRLYLLYERLHDAFGTGSHHGDLGVVMKELIALRTAVRAGERVK